MRARRQCWRSIVIVASSIATAQVGLGRPQHWAAATLDVSPGEPDRPVFEADLGPARPEQLAAPGTGRRRQP
jgi:hypothetical protein